MEKSCLYYRIYEENDPKKFQYSIRDNNNPTTEISSGNQDKLEKGQYIIKKSWYTICRNFSRQLGQYKKSLVCCRKFLPTI